MPLKALVGPNVATLLKQARAAIGPDAVILHVRRLRSAEGTLFEVAAADPDTAARPERLVGPGPNRALEMLVPAQPATGPLRIALLGPTGCGKTSLLAKLATNPRIFGNRRVGLLGLDTYRIGAVEQLKTYAEIARLPWAVSYGVEDLDAAGAALGGCDVVLIDTPGRSPRNRQDRSFVAELLRRIEPHEVHLVLPAATPGHLARGLLLEQWGPKITHLAITKRDEAPDEFAIAELAVDRGLPIRWATDGQDVPFHLDSAEDLVAAVRRSRLGTEVVE